MYYVKTCPRSADDTIASGRWQPGGAVGDALGSWVCVRVIVRALGRQRGSWCMSAYGCVSASSLGRAGRQWRQCVNQEIRLG